MAHHRRSALVLFATLLWVAAVPVLGVEMEYRIDPRARWGGTAHEGNIEALPRRLKQLFGMPLFDDGDSESLGTYVFASSEGTVLTLYYRAYDVPRKQIEAERTT